MKPPLRKLRTNVRALMNQSKPKIPVDWRREGVPYPLPPDFVVDVWDNLHPDYVTAIEFVNDSEGQPIATGIAARRVADVNAVPDARGPGAPSYTKAFDQIDVRVVRHDLPYGTYIRAATAAMADDWNEPGQVLASTMKEVVGRAKLPEDTWAHLNLVAVRAEESGQSVARALCLADGGHPENKRDMNRAYQRYAQIKKKRRRGEFRSKGQETTSGRRGR